MGILGILLTAVELFVLELCRCLSGLALSTAYKGGEHTEDTAGSVKVASGRNFLIAAIIFSVADPQPQSVAKNYTSRGLRPYRQ